MVFMDKQEIIDFRKFLGVSQEKLAQMVGTTFVTINRWENGRTKPSRIFAKEIKKIMVEHGFNVR